MSVQTEIFIEIMRKYPCLFDNSYEQSNHILKKAEAWNKIAQELNMTTDAAKRKWKNLRDSYMRFKKSENGATGMARKYCNWPWSSQMSFLDAALKYRPKRSNITLAKTEIEGPSSEPTSIVTNCNDELNQRDSLYEMALPPSPMKKRKLCSEVTGSISADSDFYKVINFLQSTKSQENQIDGVDHLFLSYAATFKSFRPKTQAMLKSKLATLFSETEINEIQEQEVSTTSPAMCTSSGYEIQDLSTPNYTEVANGYMNNIASSLTVNTNNTLSDIYPDFFT